MKHLFWGRLISIRGQLVLWYLGILALLLASLGVFQSITLRNYLRSSAALTLRHAAYQELGILGPCYLRFPKDLYTNAQTLASLLGGYETAVMIVSAKGQSLATHGLGPPGASQPLQLSLPTLHTLIGQTGSSLTSPSRIHVPTCPRASAVQSGRERPKHRIPPGIMRSLVSSGNILLVAVPLGPPGQILGYAILGRSLEPANATVARVLLVFEAGAGTALLLAALFALPIINRALRPLRRVTDTAEAIATGDLEKRAQLAHSRDEIGRLGEAFDTMVDRLQDAISASAASEERMRHFLADASHELRTPVTVLRGASQVLLRQRAVGKPEHLAALQDMHDEAIRLARLVDDLLTLSRLDTGQVLSPQQVQLADFLGEFLHRYRSAWPNRDIVLDIGGLEHTEVHVDPEALRRVLTNLVDNAARYSRPNGSITISGDSTRQFVSVTVADEGPGLKPEDAERVFDRFYRANRSRSRNSGGTGLGLSIVHGLVAQSGGSITFTTAVDRGTLVTFTLPRVLERHTHRIAEDASYVITQ